MCTCLSVCLSVCPPPTVFTCLCACLSPSHSSPLVSRVWMSFADSLMSLWSTGLWCVRPLTLRIRRARSLFTTGASSQSRSYAHEHKKKITIYDIIAIIKLSPTSIILGRNICQIIADLQAHNEGFRRHCRNIQRISRFFKNSRSTSSQRWTWCRTVSL